MVITLVNNVITLVKHARILQVIVSLVPVLTSKMEQPAQLVNILVSIVTIQQIVVHPVLMDIIFQALIVTNVLILVQSVLIKILVQAVWQDIIMTDPNANNAYILAPSAQVNQSALDVIQVNMLTIIHVQNAILIV